MKTKMIMSTRMTSIIDKSKRFSLTQLSPVMSRLTGAIVHARRCRRKRGLAICLITGATFIILVGLPSLIQVFATAGSTSAYSNANDHIVDDDDIQRFNANKLSNNNNNNNGFRRRADQIASMRTINSDTSSSSLSNDLLIESSAARNQNNYRQMYLGKKFNTITEQLNEESDSADRWQPIPTIGGKNNHDNRFYVFSAFVDRYNRSNLNRAQLFTTTGSADLHHQDDDETFFVRGIAATRLNAQEKVLCCFAANTDDGRNGSNLTRSCREGGMKPIREHWNLNYSAFFLFCPIPKAAIFVDDHPHHHHHRHRSDQAAFFEPDIRLSILAFASADDLRSFIATKSASSSRQIWPIANIPDRWNQLKIHARPDERLISLNDNQAVMTMAICVKPLHYHYNQSLRLIEFIELNRILSVSHFYFYNHSVGEEVNSVLRWYARTEPTLLTILPWQLPIESQTEIRTEGIFAAINDCLYRARRDRFTHALFIDLDEFIIPQRHDDLRRMIAEMSEHFADRIGVYSFRNAFFYLQYSDDDNRVSIKTKNSLATRLLTLRKTKRKASLHVHKQRSKCVTMPDRTIEMGNHFAWELAPGASALNVNPAIAYLHHYRVCEYGGDDCVRTATIVDRRAHHWASTLIERVERFLRSFCDAIAANATFLTDRSQSSMCRLVR